MLQGVEQTFQVQFSNKEAEAIKSVGDFYDATVEKSKQNDRELTWDEFLKVLAPYVTMPLTQINRETEFFDDI